MSRTVLVTGATHGIGAEIARAFARVGAKLALTGRDARALDAVREEVSAAGGRPVFARTYDLARRDAVFALADDVRSETDGVDILINNAGIGSREDLRSVVDFDPGFWDTTLAVNLTAPFLLCRALVPDMIRTRFGRVVNVASINGRVASPQSAAYVTSKHGLIGFTRALALEAAEHGVTVNAICPGPVDVGDDRRLDHDAARSGRSAQEFERTLTPMGGRLTPGEVAPAVVFLASEAAGSITGQALNVDRGMVMS